MDLTKPAQENTVLVAGAGIGGLTTALALHAAAIPVTVLESARELRPMGVGINLQPRAVGVLTELGLGDRLAAIGIATARNVYCDPTGTYRYVEPRGLAGGHRWPQYSVHRGRLQMLLLDAVRERLGPAAVRTATPVRTITATADTVTVNGEVTGGALVGADGLHSAVRRHCHPGPDPLLWSGVRMWRGVTERPPYLDGATMIVAERADRTQFLAYPIGQGLVNWVASVTVAEPGPPPGEANWTRPGTAADVLRHVDWDLGWLDVTDVVSRASAIFEYPMVDREPLPRWGSGRITLLGDAAHPMYPVGANGGSQAILDARALADELAGSIDVADSLARYEKARREATTAVIEANRTMHHGGAAHSAEELAAITAAYRDRTGADHPTSTRR